MNLHLWAHRFNGFGGAVAAFNREPAMGLDDLGHHVRLLGKLDTPAAWHGLPHWGASLLRASSINWPL